MASASIVQFPHPGGEHVPQGDGMPWNTAPGHKRKFMASPAAIVDANGNVERETEIVFWGEWEPPSRVVRRWKRDEPLPTVLHRPCWTHSVPDGFRQNTDPWVFGDAFLYSNCKQTTPLHRPSGLQRLSVGSLILFGSARAGRFVLDSVFVVGARLATFVPGEVNSAVPEAFQVCTIDALTTCGPGTASASFTLYRGATLGGELRGMFSFVPCLPADAAHARFARPAIDLPGVVNPASKQSPSGANRLRPLDEVQDAWSSVVEQVTQAGLSLGCRLALPDRCS